MLCENAYYIDGDESKRLNCKCQKKLDEDNLFKERCPLVYFCTVSQKFENTTDMFNCKYREKKDE